MDLKKIKKKFGNAYVADEYTFIMGIDLRFTTHLAKRFKDRTVLETCTGAGFSTISLAREAEHVITVEIDRAHQEQAVRNVASAGLSEKVSFIHGNILDGQVLEELPPVNGAFIDPDWAVTGPDHVYRFSNSNTSPPADMVLKKIFTITEDVSLVLPPLIDPQEFKDLPPHECESLYLGESHELLCLHFGELIQVAGETEFRVPLEGA